MPMVDIRGSSFEHSLTAAALEKAVGRIEAALTAEKSLHQNIIASIKSGAPGYAAEAKYLSSKSALLACAFRAAGTAKSRRPSLEGLLAIPDRHNLDKPLSEPDWVRVKLKSGMDYRFLHEFGPRQRTGQMAVRRVLECSFVPRLFQFTFMGIQPPIIQAREAILDGAVYFATLDIRNHFSSFDAMGLASLLPMLPQAWRDHVVSGQCTVMEWNKSAKIHHHMPVSPQELLDQARSGILTGAICSPIIAARSLSKLSWMHNPAWLWNYADNFLLLATTSTQLKNNIEELKARVSELPGGHFALKLVSAGHAEEGVEFLGHRVTLIGKTIETQPSAANQSAIFCEGYEMGCRVQTAMNKGHADKAAHYVKKYCDRVKGWLAALSLCDDIAHWKAVMEYLIKQEAWPLILDAETMLAAAQGDFEYSGGEYQYVVAGDA